MMKYEQPYIEVIKIQNEEDVITSSSNMLQWQENEESIKGSWSEWY